MLIRHVEAWVWTSRPKVMQQREGPGRHPSIRESQFSPEYKELANCNSGWGQRLAEREHAESHSVRVRLGMEDKFWTEREVWKGRLLRIARVRV